LNVVCVQQVREAAYFGHHFWGAGRKAGHNVADCVVVFVEEDVAAIEMWQEAWDGQTNGLEFLPRNVLLFVLWSPDAACFESAV
jgi:hypothetical protein